MLSGSGRSGNRAAREHRGCCFNIVDCQGIFHYSWRGEGRVRELHPIFDQGFSVHHIERLGVINKHSVWYRLGLSERCFCNLWQVSQGLDCRSAFSETELLFQKMLVHFLHLLSC